MGEALEKLLSAGVRISEGAEELLEKIDKPQDVIKEILHRNLLFVERKDIEEIIAEKNKIPTPVEIKRSDDFYPAAKEYPSKIRILHEDDVSGKSRCTGSVEDFIYHFTDRFERMKALIRRSRTTDKPIVETNRLKEFERKEVRLIGLVYEKRITKQGNLLFEIEDLKGTAKVLVKQSDYRIFALAKSVLLDDIVAIDGRVSDPFVFATDIMYLDLPTIREQKKTDIDVAIAYLSDLHIGSKNFLEREFSKFIEWLCGGSDRKELAGKVKYIVIAGDIIDGIGVYPLQERELAIKDVFKQYEAFDQLISRIPDYIEIIVSPGNHDAVRRADPQPLISKDLIKADVKRIGSPGWVDIEGLRHLVYHGTSLDGIISNASGLDYMHPEKPMVELLKRRHLSPIYGENLIIPERHDYMVIQNEPDVMHMGHLHKNAYTFYRGTLVLNSGTFQSRTDFQVRMGHVPSPGIVYICESKTCKITALDFNSWR
ncbi:MAG: DNA-directed DNA polymerase II small subunit [Candidatus Anstonellales archaeon]